jgi:hypothetical protein
MDHDDYELGYEGVVDDEEDDYDLDDLFEENQMDVDEENEKLKDQEILNEIKKASENKKRRRSGSGSGRSGSSRGRKGSDTSRASIESWRQDMIDCAENDKIQKEEIKLIWNDVREYLIRIDENFMTKSRDQKFKMILTVIFKYCDDLKKVVSGRYNEIIKEFSKNKHIWVMSLKRPILEGGKALLLGRDRTTQFSEEGLYNLVDRSSVKLENLAKNLENRFKITYDSDGNPTGIEIVENKKDMDNLEKLLKKMNVSEKDTGDDLIDKLNKLEIKESEKQDEDDISSEQLKGLIKLIASSGNYNKKYKILEKMKTTKRPKVSVTNLDNTPGYVKKMMNKEIRILKKQGYQKKVQKKLIQEIKNKYIVSSILPVGDWDPDYDPDVVGVTAEEWVPHLTPTKKKRFEKTKMVFKLIRKGTYVYVLPDQITINSKEYLYVRRFFDFNEYLKAYQLNLIKKYRRDILQNMPYAHLPKESALRKIKKIPKHQLEYVKNKIEKIHTYFKDKISDLKYSECDKQLRIKLKSFTSDKLILDFLKEKL